MSRHNPVARALRDRAFHKRIVPSKRNTVAGLKDEEIREAYEELEDAGWRKDEEAS